LIEIIEQQRLENQRLNKERDSAIGLLQQVRPIEHVLDLNDNAERRNAKQQLLLTELFVAFISSNLRRREIWVLYLFQR